MKNKRRKQVRRRTAAELSQAAIVHPATVVAARVGCSDRTIRDMAKAKKIPVALWIGRSPRFLMEDVIKALA